MRKNKKTEKETQAKFGHIPEAHGFLTFLKSYENLPSFRPVIETTIPDDYEICKYLTPLLGSLPHNDID